MSMSSIYSIAGVRATRKVLLLAAVLVGLCLGGASIPAGAVAAPALRVTTSTPDYVTPGKGMKIYVDALNSGNSPLSGSLTVKFKLPVGVSIFFAFEFTTSFVSEPQCEMVVQTDVCVSEMTGLPAGAQARIEAFATIAPGASGVLPGEIEVSGSGVAGVFNEPFSLSTEPDVPFAIKSLETGMVDDDQVAATQAGAPLREVLTKLSFLSEADVNFDTFSGTTLVTAPPENLRDLVVHVPPGFIGNPIATPVRCTPSQLTTPLPGTQVAACPLASQIGLVQIAPTGIIVPLYNIQPPAGSPAEAGFFFESVAVTIRAKLRPSDNGVDLITTQADSSIPVPGVEVMLWGTPGASEHNFLRGGACLQGGLGNNPIFSGVPDCPLSESSPKPFLRMPTSCTGQPLPWSVDVDTYQHPGVWHSAATTSPAVTGCENVPFDPNLDLRPSALAPHSASGADVTLSIPQDAAPEGVASADFKSVSVTLPAGMSLDPSSANGLQACTDAQLRFKEEGAAQCPAASKVGSLTLKSQLLDHALGGSVFVLSQKSEDPASGELFRIAVEVRSDQDGVDVKLPGMIKIDPDTGQVTTVFEDLPQLPFESMTLHFEGGAHPVLVTPETCGTYTTSATMTGWNGKTVHESPPFTLSQECGPRGFDPGFAAGAQNPVAGAFTQFALQVTRTDNDQEIASLSPVTLPPGLLADIGSVPRCSDAQAQAAACPQASRLGNLTAGAGVGATPVYIPGGNVYLTGPYKGAPFGLAFIVHVQAGAYDLGMVVVRAALNIDKHTAQASVQTDPLPRIVKGVPVRIRDIRVSIDRPHFMLNPTNCNTLKVTGTATSLQGATAPLASRFQVGDCQRLAFKPLFRAATSARVSRNAGAALSVTLAFPKSPQANIRSVKVKLPRQLASRLTTLQQACPDTTFAANPAACSAGSRVGSATAISPILASPLVGPAYFVSHGGAKFPELAIVLQGEGLTIELDGETFIDANDVTTSTFRSVPDAPVSSFKLTLPRGPHSALGTRSNLCKAKLVMPTTITAQDGAVIKQSTKIAVSGCGTHKHKRAGHRRG
jgi:hypothetical protein